MKKLVLLTSAVAFAFCANAQTPYVSKVQKSPFKSTSLATGKTTAVIHDSLLMSNLGPADTTIWTYSYAGDSGIVTGTNFAGMKAFAERYTFNAADSQIKVIGVAGVFVGTVQAGSTKQLKLQVWNAASKTASSRPTLSFTGFPTTGLDSVAVNFTDLAISPLGISGGYFTTPTAYLTDTFFVGASFAYSWASMGGDTVGVGVTHDGNRTTPAYTISGGDTLVNNQNCFQLASGTWLDNGFNMGFKMNYWLFPIVNSKVILGVHGITRNDFTFYGNYPNPAVNSTNFRISLAKATDVTIQVVTENGQVLNTINNTNLSVGEHVLNMETSNLASGNYLCVIRTAEGDGIISKVTVIK